MSSALVILLRYSLVNVEYCCIICSSLENRTDRGKLGSVLENRITFIFQLRFSWPRLIKLDAVIFEVFLHILEFRRFLKFLTYLSRLVIPIRVRVSKKNLIVSVFFVVWFPLSIWSFDFELVFDPDVVSDDVAIVWGAEFWLREVEFIPFRFRRIIAEHSCRRMRGKSFQWSERWLLLNRWAFWILNARVFSFEILLQISCFFHILFL